MDNLELDGESATRFVGLILAHPELAEWQADEWTRGDKTHTGISLFFNFSPEELKLIPVAHKLAETYLKPAREESERMSEARLVLLNEEPDRFVGFERSQTERNQRNFCTELPKPCDPSSDFGDGFELLGKKAFADNWTQGIAAPAYARWDEMLSKS